MKNLVILLLTILFSAQVSGQQDPQYTQYMYNMNIINPAYTGSTEGLAVGALYRSQWVGLDGGPETFTFNINVVAAGLADRCTLQLAYAIGVARPLSIYIDTHGTGKVSDDKIEKAVAESMDLTPRGIRKHLDLNKPIYARTSAYGHFGRTPDADGGFSWEKTDLADALKRAV